MPGVPDRTSFSKSTSGKKQMTRDRKQTLSLNATGHSYKKNLHSMLIFEDIRVPSLLSVITQA